MRYKIGNANIGFGNKNKMILSNNWPNDNRRDTLNKALEEALETFKLIKDLEYCDFQVEEDEIKVGIEPSYKFDRLVIITIKRKKEDSTLENGVAFGEYGMDIAVKIKKYSDLKVRSKFINFVDKYHKMFFGDIDGQ